MHSSTSDALAISSGGPPFSFVNPDHVLAGAVAGLSGRHAHETHYLARMFTCDLYEPVSFARGLERVDELGAVLRSAGRAAGR